MMESLLGAIVGGREPCGYAGTRRRERTKVETVAMIWLYHTRGVVVFGVKLTPAEP